MAVQINIETRDIKPKTAVVSVAGYVQTKEARELQRSFTEIDDQNVKRVVLDMSNVAYASSAALGLLVTYSNRKKKEEETDAVAIVGLTQSIRNVLDTLGLLPLFLLCDGIEEALQKLGVSA